MVSEEFLYEMEVEEDDRMDEIINTLFNAEKIYRRRRDLDQESQPEFDDDIPF